MQRAHRLLVAFLLVSLAASVSARADPITVTFTAFPATGDPLNTGPSTGTFTFASSLLGCGPNPRAEAVFCGAPNTLPGQGQILNISVGLGATTISFAWSGTQWTTANADIAVLNFDLSSGALLGWRLAGRPPGGTFLDPMVLSPAAAVVTDFDAVSSRFGSFVDYTISGHEGPFRGLIVTESAAPVPEPASVSLLALGLVGMGVRRWRQRKV